MLLLALLGAAPAELAPGPWELDGAEADLGGFLAVADAEAKAAFRLQTAWTDHGSVRKPCDDPDAAALAARFRAFADAFGRTAQAVRVRGEALERIAAAPTVVPLLDDNDSRRIVALTKRADAHATAWLELVAWAKRWGPPRCPTPLTGAPGLPQPGAVADNDPRVGVAVVGVGGGSICPLGLPADGSVVVLPDGMACVSAGPSCDCQPVPVLPGAVLSGQEG